MKTSRYDILNTERVYNVSKIRKLKQILKTCRYFWRIKTEKQKKKGNKLTNYPFLSLLKKEINYLSKEIN